MQEVPLLVSAATFRGDLFAFTVRIVHRATPPCHFFHSTFFFRFLFTLARCKNSERICDVNLFDPWYIQISLSGIMYMYTKGHIQRKVIPFI